MEAVTLDIVSKLLSSDFANLVQLAIRLVELHLNARLARCVRLALLRLDLLAAC